MGDVIGSILPLALGIAISPVPIIAAVLMLLSPRAKQNGAGFALGWTAGIAISLIAFALLGQLLPTKDADASQPVIAVIQLALGLALIGLAVKQWKSRPGPEMEPEMPGWMAGVESMSAGKATGLGALLAAANPKNLFLSIGAGVAIAQSEISGAQWAGVSIIWVIVAAASVLVPVAIALAAPERVAAPLAHLRTWLVANNNTVMAVLMLVLGTNLLGKGIESF